MAAKAKVPQASQALAQPASVKEVLAKVLKADDLLLGPMNSVLGDVAAISTGNMAIDHAIGVGGLPRGRSIELYGPPSSGKTTCALQTAAVAQHHIDTIDKCILYLDWEQSMSKVYAAALGLDVNQERFLFGQPDSLESGVNAARALIATGEISLVIFDSVAAMVPAAINEAATGASLPAAQARLMSATMQVLNHLLKTHGTTAIFINHIQDVFEMGGMPSRPGMPKRTTTPGGKALKFYASVRIEFTPIGTHKSTEQDPLTMTDKEVQTSQTIKVKVVKNKVAEPQREVLVRSRFGKGFSNPWTAFSILVAHKVIVKGTSGYYFFVEDRCPSLIHADMEKQKSGKEYHYLHGERHVMWMIDEYPDWSAELVRLAENALATDENDAALWSEPAPVAEPAAEVSALGDETVGLEEILSA